MEPKSLIQIISEDEFLPLIEVQWDSFCRTFNAFKKFPWDDLGVSRKCYSNLIQEAELFESFLDEHGARENKTWAYFTEYIASIRNLLKVAFFQRHLLDRYPFYKLEDKPDVRQQYFGQSIQLLEFLNRSVLNLYDECIAEAKRNKLSQVQDSIDPAGFDELEAHKRLPKDALDETVKEDDERIIDLLEKMGKVEQDMKSMRVQTTQDPTILRTMVPAYIDEKKARMLMNMVHSIQSEFDTYIKNTPIELKHEDLKNFRGFISMPLHLLEMMIWLCHFYERHEDEIRQGGAKKIISRLVDKDKILSYIVNYCFFYALHYIKEGDSFSKRILKTFVKVGKVQLPIPDPLGFHARPSTYISLIVRKYGGEAYLNVDDEKFDAKSVMSLLQAGGVVADKGYRTVEFEGDQRILDDIKILSSYNYCEEEPVPPELEYLSNMRNS